MNGPLQRALLDPGMWRRLDAHLDRLIDLEPAERASWLERLTASEPAMADLLRELLAKPNALAPDGLIAISLFEVLGAARGRWSGGTATSNKMTGSDDEA